MLENDDALQISRFHGRLEQKLHLKMIHNFFVFENVPDFFF